MKIAVLTSSFPRYLGDYHGNFVYYLAREQVKRGNDVYVICPHIPGTHLHEVLEGSKIHRFPYFYPCSWQRLFSDTGMDSALRHSFLAWLQLPLFFLCEGYSAGRIIRQEKIELIHTHWLVPQGLVGALLHHLTGIPHIVTIHGSDLNILKTHTFLHPVCRFITRNSTMITVNSRYMNQQLLTVSPEAGQKVQVIPMGIDPERSGAASITDMKQRHNAGHLILCVGRLIDWKGTKFLIAAMPAVLEKFPDTKLIIIGTGPERDGLTRNVRELGISDQVEFSGAISAADLPSYYRSADVFVLPSINRAGKTEGLGVVLLEAMASGCPVIGSNIGGIPDIITDGKNGFLVPEQDPTALAEKIIRIMSDAEMREKFRKNGYARIQESFTWTAIADQFSSVYSQVLGKLVHSGDL